MKITSNLLEKSQYLLLHNVELKVKSRLQNKAREVKCRNLGLTTLFAHVIFKMLG